MHIGTDPTPEPLEDPYWFFGIQLVNATTAKISLFNIQGSSNTGGIAAIQIGGNPGTHPSSISTRIRNGSIWKYVRGIESRDAGEGLHVQSVAIREVEWGIEMTDNYGTTLANNTILARRWGIQVKSSQSVSITNNLIYRMPNTVYEFRGIEVYGSTGAGKSFTGVIGNKIHSLPPDSGDTTERNGIVLDAAEGRELLHTVVEGNNTVNMTRGIWLTSTFALRVASTCQATAARRSRRRAW
jgi:hypothetical protein